MKSIYLALIALLVFPTPFVRAECNDYVVQPRDTLSAIAVRHHTTYPELARLNGIANPNLIQVGQCLKLLSTTSGNPVTGISSNSLKGIALVSWNTRQEDIAKLGAAWYYGWGEYCAGDPLCVNMVRSMQAPNECYSVLLVGNEPNAREPFGAYISPTDAVAKVKAIHAQCPQTKLVVGNVSADDWGNGNGYTWLSAFLRQYPDFNQAIGVHCYTQNLASWCIDQLKAMRSLYVGEMWVTEFAVLSADPSQFSALLTGMSKFNFTRIAVYTNRNNGADYDIPNTGMIGGDGNLTGIGKVYADWGR